MTVPMNKTFVNSSRDRAQLLYNKNAELEIKRRKAACAKIPSDPNTWQQMRDNYESILLENDVFSEQHDIEYALWQLHYKRIEELRAHYNTAQASAPQNAKGQARSRPERIIKIRSQLKTFLSEATGFYHDLMVKIRVKYGLSLGYMPNGSQSDKDENKSIDAKKGLISCHRCFIYLGDLARYKGLYGEGDLKTRDFAAALSYYKQAATLWPSSGNPHHQLAILASYSGDEMLAVHHYFRSLAVDTPFITARDNLIIAFEKNRQSYCQLLANSKYTSTKKSPSMMNGKGSNRGETPVSMKDRKTKHLVVENVVSAPETLKAFSIRFVRLNGILFSRTSLETFEEVFSVVRTDFLHLLSSGQDEVFNFGSDFDECKLFITRFISIMIFTVYNANKETKSDSYAEILQCSVILQNAFTAIFDIMALIVDRCFELKEPSRSFLLHAIMIFVEFLACGEDNIAVANEMDEKQATARSRFWNSFVLFLNKILLSSAAIGSHPDDSCFSNMSRANYFGTDGNKEKNARLQRIVAAGKAIATNIRLGQQGIYFDAKLNKFFYGFEPHAEISAISPIQHEINEGEDEDEVIVFKPSVSSEGVPVNSTISLISNGGSPLEQFAQPKWMENEEAVEIGLSNLNFLGNGLNKHDHATMIPSKFDSVMTSAPGFDGVPPKTKFYKSPVSRPVRHFGPPPGFNTPKFTNENPGLDDYSWLDGYQLPYSGSYSNDGFGNAFNCLPQPNKLLNSRKTSLGMECFPFPGKQASSTVSNGVGIGNENGKQSGDGWLQIPGHSSLYKEQVNMGSKQHYQIHSLWDDRFFV